MPFLAAISTSMSNKHGNKKWVNRKTLVTSILQMLTTALLRRWLWVRASPNPIFVECDDQGYGSHSGRRRKTSGPPALHGRHRPRDKPAKPLQDAEEAMALG